MKIRYPFNIKSSGYDAADNFSSKSAILWALTKLSEEDVVKKGRRWQQFQKALESARYDDNGRDYYILSINKNTNEVHLSSLKTLNKLTPNGNNSPSRLSGVIILSVSNVIIDRHTSFW